MKTNKKQYGTKLELHFEQVDASKKSKLISVKDVKQGCLFFHPDNSMLCMMTSSNSGNDCIAVIMETSDIGRSVFIDGDMTLEGENFPYAAKLYIKEC